MENPGAEGAASFRALGAALIAKESGLKALADGNLPPSADRKLGDATFFS